jgi:glycosyltransferase involved in cell wall biosynthesis
VIHFFNDESNSGPPADVARRLLDGIAEELVSVVIPAYNAQATLDDTLNSVRSQTHRNLEIVVVDDGSTDDTAIIAQRHSAVDARLRIIRQDNAGVAAARNTGIAATSGRYVAPIDADDLWAPSKIERQLLAAKDQGKVGLVYSWFAVIDQNNSVLRLEDGADAEGVVLRQLLLGNFVGNGSSALILRSAIEFAGFYDVGLRASGCEGAEDYKMYLEIAEQYEFAIVPDYLTGYREYSGNMSSDVARMVRSRDICVDEFAMRHPELRDAIENGRTRFLRVMIIRSVRERQFAVAARLFATMLRRNPLGAAHALIETVKNRVTRRRKHLSPGQEVVPWGTSRSAFPAKRSGKSFFGP